MTAEVEAIRRFNRYELKYVLRFDEYRRLSDRLREFMNPDSHGDADGFYPVTSLYYDSPGHACFWSKIDGVKFRRKLRVRAYGRLSRGERPDRAFAEIKQRVNKTVQKRRLSLPLDEALALCAGDEPPDFPDPADLEVALEIQYLALSLDMAPVCVVSYLRQAFQGGTYEAGLRITFDVNLKSRIHDLGVHRSDGDRPFLPRDLCVMEIKVNERIPLWLTSLLGAYECVLTRVSKYCLGLQSRHGALAEAYAHPIVQV